MGKPLSLARSEAWTWQPPSAAGDVRGNDDRKRRLDLLLASFDRRSTLTSLARRSRATRSRPPWPPMVSKVKLGDQRVRKNRSRQNREAQSPGSVIFFGSTH